jgi:hypothetical protein
MAAQPMSRLLRPVREWINRSSAQAGMVVREMIGRVSYVYPAALRTGAHLSLDKTIPDYQFWDKFRRGKARGYETVGVLGSRINNTIVDFSLGSGLSLTLDVNDDEVEDAAEARNPDDTDADDSPRVYTDRILERFVKRNLTLFMDAEKDKLGLGDCYIVVNADGSLTQVSPDTVEPTNDPLDYRKLLKVVITTRLEQVTITDEYTAEARTVRVKGFDEQKQRVDSTTVYPNLIGRIPVTHWANDKGANELYGHPIYEALYRVFSRYDALIEKALDGVELLGNPIPVFTGVADVMQMLEDNGVVEDEEYTDIDGNTVTRRVLALDKLPVVILGIGADMKMVAPDKGFTSDIEKMLQTLFLLICFHIGIPEFIFGGGMTATRASTESQFPAFAQFIQSRRLRTLGVGADDFLDAPASGGLYELIDLWLRTRQLTDPKIVVAPTKASFPEITPEDAAVLLQRIIYAKGVGLLTDATTLDKLRLVSDAAKEVANAKAEAPSVEDDYQTLLNQAAHEETEPGERQPEPESANITDGKPPLPAGGRRARLNNGRRVGEMNAADPTMVVVGGTSKRRRKKRVQQAVA